MQQRIAGVIGNVAELDCDIIIDEAPDALTPQLEQFQSLVELKKYDANGEVPVQVDREGVTEPEGQAADPQGHGGSRKAAGARAHRPSSSFNCAAPSQRSRKPKARPRSIWRERGTSAYPINLIRKTINCRRSCRTCRR